MTELAALPARPAAAAARGRTLLMTLDAVGGVWRYAMDLAAALVEAGDRVAFLGFGPAPDPARRAEAEALGRLDWSDAPLDWMAQGPGALSAVPQVIARTADQTGADLVHVNLPSQAAGLDCGRPVVAVSHSCVTTWFAAVRGGEVPQGWDWHEAINRDGLRRAAATVVPSRSHGQSLRAAYGPLPHMHVVPNATAAPETRTADEPFAIALGRWWDEGKNGATLDAAAALCDWPVVMLGPDRAPGEGAAHLPLRHADHRGEVPHDAGARLLRRAGLFVSPSVYEPFGLAALEAARARLPLLLADIPTYRELWEGAARFFPPRDPAALAAAIDALAADPAGRRDLGAAAAARAARFSLAAQARAMREIYASLNPLRPARPLLQAR